MRTGFETQADAAAAEATTHMDVEAGVDADIGVDVVARIDIPVEIPLQRLEEIESGQRELKAGSLIAGGERASFIDRVTALERSNMRL
ncbi:hypothetical protein Tco_1505349 [Tanacetum coccineum]